MGIPYRFDPMGTPGARAFPLPPSLTDGLIDAVIAGRSSSWQNMAVSADMEMSVSEAATALLGAETIIYAVAITKPKSAVYIQVASASDFYNYGVALEGQPYAAVASMYQGTVQRVSTGFAQNEGALYGLSKIQDFSKGLLIVSENAEREAGPRGISGRISNIVKFTNVSKVFFWDKVMTAEEIREKMQIIKCLEL